MRRSFFDYAVYLVRAQRGASIILLIDASLLVLAVCAFVKSTEPSSPARNILSALLGLATLKLVWSCFKITRTLRTYFHASGVKLERRQILNQPFEPVRMDEVLPSREEVSEGFVAQMAADERVFRSPKIDEFLWTEPALEVVTNTIKRTRVRRLIAGNQSTLLRVLTRYYVDARARQSFFNEKKLCLARHLDPERGEVECFCGEYFDSVLTNEACTRVLTDRQGENLLADLTHMFPLYHNGREVHLNDIAQSAMNDHIGISTLAFTRDAHLVVWEQSPQAQQSQNLLAPTGSGSCDWKDRVASDFLATVRRSMERELCEESGRNGLAVGPSVVDSTLVLGFYRWIRRGGKPEFTGITRLKVDRHYLEPNPAETQRPKARQQHMFPLKRTADLPETLNEIRNCGRLSVPLAMTLDSLESFWEMNEQRLGSFLSIPTT